jgi:hypothetical protein
MDTLTPDQRTKMGVFVGITIGSMFLLPVVGAAVGYKRSGGVGLAVGLVAGFAISQVVNIGVWIVADKVINLTPEQKRALNR